jgi:hypothetical protein
VNAIEMHRHAHSIRSAANQGSESSSSGDSWVATIYVFVQQLLYSLRQSFNWQAAVLVLFFVIAVFLLIQAIVTRIPIRSKSFSEDQYEPDTYNVRLAARPSKRKRDRTSIQNQRLQFANGDTNVFDALNESSVDSVADSEQDPDTFTEFKKRMSLNQRDSNKTSTTNRKSESRVKFKDNDQYAHEQVQRLARRTETNPLELSPLRDDHKSNQNQNAYFETMPLLSVSD